MAAVVKPGPKYDWWIPVGLLLLGLLPLFGGVVRLIDLASGAVVTDANARYMASPFPITLHVIVCSLYFTLGAFQFWPRIRSSHPKWHRRAGRILIPAGLLSAISGMWMALAYPPAFGDGRAVMFLRLLVGTAIVVSLVLGFVEIKRQSIATHRAWMIRAYALAIAAGTQPLTLFIAFLLSGKMEEVEFTSGMAAGWLLNLAVAEWVTRKKPMNAPA
ncbi:MAG TPA: DUF2306 domain-containing protein [Gammaproteobacteria bacterium]|nr:DUF2306 domain-containing protein [Gammaproteobacteria bacterium]